MCAFFFPSLPMQKIRVKEPHTSFHHGVHLKVVSDMNSYGIFVTVAHHRLIFLTHWASLV